MLRRKYSHFSPYSAAQGDVVKQYLKRVQTPFNPWEPLDLLPCVFTLVQTTPVLR